MAYATDEWTHVVQSKKSRRPAKPHPTSPNATPPVPAEPTVTADEITATHKTYQAQWVSSQCYKDLMKLIQEKGVGKATIIKALCFGVGSFDAASGWTARRKAHVQVTAFLSLVEWLEQACGTAIECHFQEPAFTTADKEFISALGHSVIESPAGFEAVNETTFVYGVHLYAPVYSMTLEKSLPAIFIGTGWDAWDDIRLSVNAQRPERIRQMEDTFKKATFPQDDGYTFSSTVIYWKPTLDSSPPKSKTTSR